jgi:hypothetical protein
VLSRFWLVTFLIVAFVAASWAFGLRLGGADGNYAGFADRPTAAVFADDEGRGR